MRCLVLCAHPDPAVADRLRAGLADWAAGAIDTVAVTDGHAALERALGANQAKEDLPIVFVGTGLTGMDGPELLRAFHDEPALRATRKVLLAGPEAAALADALLQEGAIHGRLDPVIDPASLHKLTRTLLTDHVVQSAPHLIDSLHHVLDLRSLAGAFAAARENLHRLNARLRDVHRPVLSLDEMSDDKVESAMIEEIDRLLDHPPRMHFGESELLVHEGDDHGSIWVILDGHVRLYRTVDGEDVTFHSETAGRIVGLMSLSLQSPVFFSCRATSPVTALRLSRAQIHDAVRRSPAFSNYLITVIMRSMARRNKRSAQLLVQVRTLNRLLANQRDDLKATLAELRSTQSRLIESEKMATLGNLAAGMAHELNNPVAAILQAAEHLHQDLRGLLESAPELAAAAAALDLGLERQPLSTRDERKIRAELAAGLGTDAAHAQRLVAAGLRSAADYAAIRRNATTTPPASLLDQVESGGEIGTSLRNIGNCSRRIAALVRSLKVYARADQEWSDDTDVNSTLEDVLAILTSKIKHLTLHKEYSVLPPIRCIPSQLQQVWTNLIHNAVQAMDGCGEITLRTTSPRPGVVHVEIEDDGPGIPPDVQQRIYDPRFTTKSGRVEFGLGLGLPICRSIIDRHGGSLTFDSRPGRTVFTVELPVLPPASDTPCADHSATP